MLGCGQVDRTKRTLWDDFITQPFYLSGNKAAKPDLIRHSELILGELLTQIIQLVQATFDLVQRLMLWFKQQPGEPV